MTQAVLSRQVAEQRGITSSQRLRRGSLPRETLGRLDAGHLVLLVELLLH